ncbi:hypothetical protein D9758_018526 [Tetrapyrgos nigripes]|uniref:Acyl-CoA N-acyltransferase n=1 Tax=Tetrapyrgos nigripes TaxID=182062 RepID=A0A8H5BAW7_9AGAR|nr:hypothetical protein D9758_018526 [Tetrapyrgos nigripes]
MSNVSSQEGNYTLRRATLSDITPLTRNVIPHVSHDGFHDYFFPKQDAYPDDFYRWWRRYYRNILLRPYSVLFIAEDEQGGMKGLGMWTFARGKGVSGPEGLDIAKDSWFEDVSTPGSTSSKTKSAPTAAPTTPHSSNGEKTVIEFGKKLFVGDDVVHWMCPEFIVFPDFKSGEDKTELMAALAPVVHGWGIKQSDIDGISAWALCTIKEKAVYEKEGYELVQEVQCGPSTCFAMKYRGE